MSAPLKVLLVEDRTDDAELILLALGQAEFDVTAARVETEAQLVAALSASVWDVILTDFTLPGFSAIQALEVVARSGLDVPVLVVSGTIGEEIAAEMVRCGADDYILKHNLTRLLPAIQRALRDAETRRARAKAEQMAYRLAAIVQSSLDAIISETADGIVTSWNPAAELLFGWTADEVIGKKGGFNIPPDRAGERAAVSERLERGERHPRIDTVRLHRDGRPIDVSVSYSLVRDPEGRPIGLSKIVRDIAERKRWDEERQRHTDALRASEATHRALAESIPNLVWIALPDGKVEYFNGRWESYTGIPVAELGSGNRYDILHGDDVSLMHETWNHSLRDQHPFEMKYRLRRADGEYRWHLARAVPMRDEAGTILRWFGTCTDIHDQLRNEESMARDALVLAHVRDSVIVTNLDGVVTYWNEGATRQFGWTAPEMVGRPVSSRVPEAERPAMEDMIRAVAGGQDFAGEFHDHRKDGSRIWIEARVSRIQDRSGKTVGTMGVSHDITARRQALEALELRDRAIQAVTQGILITDPDLKDNPIIYASPGFERLTGYTAAEVFGRNCRFLQGKDSDPEAVARIRAAVADGVPLTEQLVNYRKDGGAFWTELSISPVRDDAGRLTHFVGVQADVTARRHLENQYRHSQKMEAIGVLAGGVAHDFNNLLTIINGYSDLMLQDLPESDSSREMLQIIRKAGSRSAGLTRQLLAFSRQQVNVPKTVVLNEIVSDLEKMLRRIIGEDIDLAVSLDANLDASRLDAGQVEQVIMNLAVNARDAMPAGGRLTIETRNVDLDDAYVQSHSEARKGPFVLLAVSDTGSGMDRATCDRIFEPFFSTKPVGQGTGLGLSVVHGIVQQHGGHIRVYSEVGVGTVFKIYWPSVSGSRAAPRTRLAPKRAPRGTETLLLVEDDEAVRILSRQVLSSCGYTVLEADSGEDALRLMEEPQPPIQILITDVVMPGVGGRKLAEALSARYPGLKVLYVSGYTDDAIVRHGILHDQINFLQKPFSPVTLAVRVRELLDA